ncbi:ferredoxin [Saccharopolyspora pogona]|uniref:ferredoxin n=1 Tax=Saccharopolyspora pogona TaxID=333966 RepID=UPI001683D293|nr:ferredoxin [Saccharopolyspora pogona]
MYRISVDSSRCQGHARCMAFAPEAFDFDDEGYAFVPDGLAEAAELPESIRRAEANCPERAVKIEET